jgi:hypothetical protein
VLLGGERGAALGERRLGLPGVGFGLLERCRLAKSLVISELYRL